MNPPVSIIARGTKRQKCALAKTALTPANCAAIGSGSGLVVGLGNGEEKPRGDGQGEAGEAEEDVPPAGDAEGSFERRRGGERTKSARGHDPAGQRSLPLEREPQRKSLEGRHQTG
jgi:hypothetical protein